MASLSGHTFFWKPEPSENQHNVYSQWLKSAFSESGVAYSTAEQYMMAKKAELFGDTAMLQRILEEHNPRVVMQLGRKVANFNGAVWDRKAYGIVVQGNKLKFGQNADMGQLLLNTGNTLMVEASPMDRIWGIGLGEEAARAVPESEWPGSNLLGKALVDVRQWLRDGGRDAAPAADVPAPEAVADGAAAAAVVAPQEVARAPSANDSEAVTPTGIENATTSRKSKRRVARRLE